LSEIVSSLLRDSLAGRFDVQKVVS
jgi:hypothetical protein